MSYFNYTADLRQYLKHEFTNVELVKNSYSQMQQDMFVLSVLDGKQNGMYVEIGAHHPIDVNNTYLLENSFGWQGISFELDQRLVSLFNNIRKNPCLAGDATKMDYKTIFEQYQIGPDIDYLSVDIEPPDLTFKALCMVMESGLKPTVITFEHEAMSGQTGQLARIDSRQYLIERGYTMLVKDVSNLGVGALDYGVAYPVEDWWVLQNRIRPDILDKLRADTVEYICSNDTVYNLNR